MKRDPNCQRCPLHQTAEYVCLLGKGPEPCKAMIIGEAPGEREDDSGKPFVGRAGRLLTEIMSDAGIEREDVYITNAVNCRPPNNRTPKKKEIDACRYWLEKQLAVVKPRYVMLLGNVALQAMLKLKGIKKHRGRPIEVDGRVILPAYHPSYILRGDGRERPSLEQDMRTFKEIIDFGGIPEERTLNIEIVDTWRKVDRMIDELSGVVSTDLETTCLYPWAPEAKVVTLGHGTRETQFIVPIHHSESRWTEDDIAVIIERIDEKLQDCVNVYHAGKFDTLWMKVHYGVDWRVDHDTLMGDYVLDENSLHDLEFIAQKLFGAPKWDIPLEEKQGGASIARVGKYHAHDLFYTRNAYFKQRKQLKEDQGVNNIFTHLLMPATNAYREIEYQGCYINVERMDEVEQYLLKEIAAREEALAKWGDINWGSPKQVGELLYGKLKIKCPIKTKKGADSTGESALKMIDHPAVEDLLKFRGAKQQHSFFIKGWRPYIHKSRIHPSFKLHGTVTGRPSCIRKGTQIQVPGRTKSIENIKVGDWVYCFDDNKKLSLRQVTWAGYTGRKKCFRIHWVGQGGQHDGFLDATEDHRIRMIDGSYVKVSDLEGGRFIKWRGRYHNGEHVLALHRQSHARNFLYATGHDRKLRENRVVFEAVNGWSPEHVHHKDDNPLNDHPDNLEGMTHKDHTSKHARRDRVESPNWKSIQRALKKSGTVAGAARLLECDRTTLGRRINRYNHMITHIEELPGLHPVYDITVDGTHNFIANEICVHNCEHPNFQQVPRDPLIRSLIHAPPGYELLEADLSQIELRIVAELSRDPAMMEAFLTGIDIHWLTALGEIERGAGMMDDVLETAARLSQRDDWSYGDAIAELLRIGPDACKDYDEKWGEVRKKAKAVNFGYVFGMWWKKFKRYAKDNYDLDITDEQAQESRESFFEKYQLEKWHQKQQRFAREHGYVRSLTGRKRRLPHAQDRMDTYERAEAWRQAINSPVQSFASDLLIMTLLQMMEEYPDRKIFRPITTVHDALLAEVRLDHVEQVLHRVEEIMKGPDLLKVFNVKLTVPICGEAKLGPWGRGLSLSRWKFLRQHGMTTQQFFANDNKLIKRFWEETKGGKKAPSYQLKKEMVA